MKNNNLVKWDNYNYAAIEIIWMQSFEIVL